jgi:hypothetical protein
MGNLIYGRFDIHDSPKPAGPRGMCRARDEALRRDVELHWWAPASNDFENACQRLHRCGDTLDKNTGAEVFDDERLLYLAVPEADSAKALARLQQEHLFTEAPAPEQPVPPTPLTPAPISQRGTQPPQLPLPLPPPRPRHWLVWWSLGLALLVGLAVWRTHRIPPSPVVEVFRGDHGTIERGQALHLEWKVANADQVSISPDLGRVALEGNTAVYPTANTRYVLTAKGHVNPVTAEVTVVVNQAPVTVLGKPGAGTSLPMPSVVNKPPEPKPPPPPAIATFVAEPSEIQPGQAVTLSWRAENATEVRIEPLSDAPRRKLNPDDSILDHPARTVKYTLTALGSGKPATLSVTVHVIEPKPPSILSFKATPPSIQQCGAAQLSWDVENATRIFIDSTDVTIPSGSMEVHPQRPTDYVLSAQGRTGPPITQTITVFVSYVKWKGPPDCGELIWTGVVGPNGQITIDATTRRSDPPARDWGGTNLPHAKVKVTAEENYIQVTSQPYLTGRPVIALSSQRSGLITIHLWWTHVR